MFVPISCVEKTSSKIFDIDESWDIGLKLAKLECSYKVDFFSHGVIYEYFIDCGTTEVIRDTLIIYLIKTMR